MAMALDRAPGSEGRARHLWAKERDWALAQAQRVLAGWRGVQKSHILEYVVLRAGLMDLKFDNVRYMTPGIERSADKLFELTAAACLAARAIKAANVCPMKGESLRFTCSIPERLEELLPNACL
jgi:hypothetical protein